MKNIFLRIQLIFLTTILSTNALYSQEFSGIEATNKVKEAERVRYNPIRKSVDFVQLKSSTEINESNHFNWLTSEALKTDNANTLQLKDRNQDKQGYVHYQYKQYYKGLPIEYGTYKAHFNEGKLVTVNGEYYSDIQLKTTPSLSKAEAFSRAILAMKATKFKDENSIGLEESKEKGELLILPLKGKMYLAYKFDIYAIEPLKRVYIYIDAQTGKVLYEENRIHHIDTQGSALTGFSGTQEITTDSMSSGIYRLQETGRGNGIRTKNLNNGSNYSTATDFTDSDNVWNTSTIDKYAYDAHFGAERTYDFFFDNFGLNSYDGAGAIINSYVHYDNNYVNAFWDGTQMTYGDGNGTSYYPLTSMEIVGHEITHAVTEHSAGLIYNGESGALNESFSDIFGNTIRFTYTPSTAGWYSGNQIVISGGIGTPFRNMADPNEFSCADTYGGDFWNYGDVVHYDSGVQNFWYYLLSTGGSGVNDHGNSYTVNGIGLNDAAAIAFRNLTVYLTPSSTFADARYYAIQSATDLFGSCSNQVIQTTNAWYAVGVGGIFSNAVVSGFTSAQNYFCVVPTTVNFSNASLNASTYIWDFGDGSATSTQSNPSHIYTTAGTFNVSLIANGSGSCSASDTLVHSNFLTIVNGGGPISPSCTPSTNSFCCGIGIRNFQFGSINKSSGNATEGYGDFTCGNSTGLTAGDPVAITVLTGTSSNENVKAWIDYNNNGIMDTLTEQVFSSYNKNPTHSGIVHTSLNATLNTPLRMRVTDDVYTVSSFGPCSNSQNGQTEDYTVTFTANTQAPVADFMGSDTIINVGGSISFDDLSIHAPTSWVWTFDGGVPASSTNQNPIVRYDSLGAYLVRLSVANSFGTDSIVKYTYITVVNSINLCSGTTSTMAESGQLYDSGGPSGPYNTLENCTLLIEPSCAISVSMSFSQFNSENYYDQLTIYDGTSTAGPLLLTASGGMTLSPVTANSGKMLIIWHSDGSVNYDGFTAQWSSVVGSPNPPIAGFSIQDPNPPISTPTVFNDQTTNTPIAWHWDFGDGNGSTQQNPTHSFSASGTYLVRLIAINCVSRDTTYGTITVQSNPTISTYPDTLTANLSCNESITVPLTIYNSGSGDLVFSFSGNDAGTPVSILAFTYGVDMSGEFPNTIGGINKYFTDYTLDTTASINSAYFQSKLAGKDVLLIPEQETGSTSHYSILGPIILNFANSGGTVIVCGSAANGSFDLIYTMGLFTGSYFGISNTGTAIVSDTSEDIMDGIPSTFGLTNSSFMHTITNTDKVLLASYNSYDLVTYREIGDGMAVYIGFDYFAVNNETERIISNAVRYSRTESLASWISPDTISGSTAPADSSIIYFTFSSSGLSNGSYSTYLLIYSNDSLNPVDSILITLNVGNEVCANFTHSTPSICSGQVDFLDSTLNSPISWVWDFGDGTSSTLQNPFHAYTDTGNYAVRLIVCSSINCDTILKSLRILGVIGPKTAACTPITTAYCCGMGITSVQFNDISKVSPDGVEGYTDFTCNNTTTVISGVSYPITVSTGTQYNENVSAWIDFNNDGILADTTELVFVSLNQRPNHSGTVTIPNNAVVNTPIRMRVLSDYYANDSISVCRNPQYGQAEDYTVFVLPNTLPPQANFNIDVVNTCSGEVHFYDNSGNTPTSWYWDFGDGSNSTLQNPVHLYDTAGTFYVSLIVINAFGTDTVSYSTTVNVLVSSISHSLNLYADQTIQFSSNSGGAANYLWDFGDGYLASLENPNHIYTLPGSYLLSLTVSNSSCSVVIIDTLHIGVTSVENIKALISFELFPNPFQTEISIAYQIGTRKNISLEVVNILGKSVEIIIANQLQAPGTYSYSFSTAAVGVYFIKFSSDEETVVRKVVKM